jgi:hypothetical protein
VWKESPWFSVQANATQPLPAFAPAWPAPSDVSEHHAQAPPGDPTTSGTTRSGLPKRVRSVPPAELADRPLISTRDPKTTSGKLAAFAAATRASRSAM